MTDEEKENAVRKLLDEVGEHEVIRLIKKLKPPQHRWQFYVNGTFCAKCGRRLGTTLPCDYQ